MPGMVHFEDKLHGAWILIEEARFVPIDKLGELACLLMVGVRLLWCGDCDNQFDAICDRSKNVSLPNVTQSLCLDRHVTLHAVLARVSSSRHQRRPLQG